MEIASGEARWKKCCGGTRTNFVGAEFAAFWAEGATLEIAIRGKFQEDGTMSPRLQEMLKQVEQLSYPEKLELIQGVTELMKTQPPQTSHKRKLSEFRGTVQYPLLGEDAQEWVTRTRREGDEHREQLLCTPDCDRP